MKTMRKEAGFNDNDAIAGALTYLQKHGAIYLVPHEFRTKHEPKHKQVRVWQLTGVIRLNGEWMNYLTINNEHRESLIQEATEMGVENVFTDYLDDCSGEPNCSGDPNGLDDNR